MWLSEAGATGRYRARRSLTNSSSGLAAILHSTGSKLAAILRGTGSGLVAILRGANAAVTLEMFPREATPNLPGICALPYAWESIALNSVAEVTVDKPRARCIQ